MRQLWWQLARVPLAVFVLVIGVLATTDLDVRIAQSLFFDGVRSRWAGSGSWWIESVIHTGGRWAIRGVVLLALLMWAGTFVDSRRRSLRRPLAYFLLSMVLAVGTVGLLKVVTNVDCPWDLTLFGGKYPFVHLFAHRPDGLRAGQCFPAAHASSGYALMVLYFVFRERSPTLARSGLLAGIATGLVFGLAQQARGAHFLSHDVWSACICWSIALTVYTSGFGGRLWRPESAHLANAPDATASAPAASSRAG